MSHANPFQLATEHWRSCGVPLLPPASEDEIERTFAKLSHPLSNDIRRLYSATGGFADHEVDGLWSLWSLRQIVQENIDRDSHILWFADFLICSHMYGFQFVTTESSAVVVDHNISTHPPYVVADSVEEFIEKYLDNPENVEALNF